MLLWREMKKRKGEINFQRKMKYRGRGNRLRRLPEERWLKGWRMDLEKVILWPARVFAFLWKGNKLQEKRETESSQEQGGRVKEEDIWGGGVGGDKRGGENMPCSSNSVGGRRATPRNKMPASLGRN